jgi:hypothetical protein
VTILHMLADGAYLGSRDIPAFEKLRDFGPRATRSLAYFCPRCGEVWGRLATDPAGYTQCLDRFCLRHGDGRLGTLPYNSPDWTVSNVAADWPRAALLRELEAELKQQGF